MAEKGFAPARGRRGIRVYARLLMRAGLALWLMLGAVAAQRRSATLFQGQVVQSGKADPEAQEKIDEAFKAFEELLAVSKGAAAMNSHWRVTLASWRNAQAAWEQSSTALPTPVQGLKRCAAPLATARGMIERADTLFLQARDSSDPMRAVELLGQHKKLLKQADDPLKRAERCYRAVRNAYLKGKKLDDRSPVKLSGKL